MNHCVISYRGDFANAIVIYRSLSIEYDKGDEVVMRAFTQALLKTRYSDPSTIPEIVSFIEQNNTFRDVQISEFFKYVSTTGGFHL